MANLKLINYIYQPEEKYKFIPKGHLEQKYIAENFLKLYKNFLINKYLIMFTDIQAFFLENPTDFKLYRNNQVFATH